MDQQPNLDVYQMKADLEAQAYSQPTYGDYQANLTAARTAYGDVPAMMMTGAQYAGATYSGAIRGAGNALTAIGSQIRPATYTPPARVVTGYYGQYQQDTGVFSSMMSLMGMRTAPRGVSGYQYGYYNAADMGERLGGVAAATGYMVGGMTVGGPVGSAVGSVVGGLLGSAISPILAGAGATVGGLAGGLLGYTAVDAIADVVAQRRQMNAFLESSSFRYVGAGSSMADPRLGAGMDPRSRRTVTDFMHRMDVKDPMMNMDDLFGVMQGATSLGLFAGTRDIDDFKKKFKEIVDGVKHVSKALHTSLQEGLQVMKDLKSIDITPDQMGKITFQAEVAGKVAGRTPYEIVNLGLQGAELFRGTGIEMKLGYQANVMNISAVRAARDAGILSQEAINQAGGEESLAQQMTSSGLQFMQSAGGRGFGAGFFQQGAGAYGFNRGAFMNQMTSPMAMDKFAIQANQNIGTISGMIQYEAYQDKYMSELGKTFGGDTTLAAANYAMMQAKFMQQADPNIDMKAAFRLVATRDMGWSTSQADLMLGRIEGARKEFETKRAAVHNTAMARTVDEALSTRGLTYSMNMYTDWFKGVIEPAARVGEDVSEKVKESTVKFWEERGVGIYRANIGEAAPYEAVMRQGPVKQITAAPWLNWIGDVDLTKTADPMQKSKYQGKLLELVKSGEINAQTDTTTLLKKVSGKEVTQINDDEYRAISQGLQEIRMQKPGLPTQPGQPAPDVVVKTGLNLVTSTTEEGGKTLTKLQDTLKTDEAVLKSAKDREGTSVDLDGGISKDVRHMIAGAAGLLAGGAVAAAGYIGSGYITAQTFGGALPAAVVLASATSTAATATGMGVYYKTLGLLGGMNDSQGRQIETAIKALENAYPTLRGAIQDPKDKEDPDEIVLRREGGKVITIKKSKYEEARALLTETPQLTSDEAKQVVASGKAPDVRTDLKTYLEKSKGKKITLEGVSQALYGTSFGKIDASQKAGLMVAAQGVPEVQELLDENTKQVDILKKHSDAVGTMQLKAQEDYIKEKTGKFTTDLEHDGIKAGLTPEVVKILTLAKYEPDAAKKDKILSEAATKYMEQTKGPKPGTGALMRGLRNIVDRGANDVIFQDVRGSMQETAGIQHTRGRQEVLTEVAGDLANVPVEQRNLAMSVAQRVMSEGGYKLLLPKGMTKEESEAFGGTARGREMLTELTPRLELLEQIKKKAVADPKASADSILGDEQLRVDEQLRENLQLTMKSQHVSLAEAAEKSQQSTMTSYQRGVASTTAVTAPASGSTDPSVKAQGTGQEQDVVQMNINVSVLTALNALNTNLRAKPAP